MPTPLRLAPFLFALLCFLLPFAEVSCDSKEPSLGSVRVVKVTGWELMTGNKTDEQNPNRAQSRDPNYLLLASAGLLILGLLAAASPASRKFAFLCGLAAAGCLVYLSTHLREAFISKDTPANNLGDLLKSDSSSAASALGKFSSELMEKSLIITAQPGLYAAAACALIAALLCLPGNAEKS